ncbi:MAG: molybdate ABC transporter substrate-binding protein [Saezia sp.]
MMGIFWKALFAALICSASAFSHAETLTVSAASSLTNAFTDIGEAFEAKHQGHKVEFNFAASGALLQQILQGAPVDVFASADQATMDKAQAEGMIKNGTRVDFIGNGLVLIVPIDSKLTLSSLSDLTVKDIQHVAIGNPDSTPNARYARAAMQEAGVWAAVEPKLVLATNVRQSLTYVSRGEVEAGFVFSTDAKQDEGKVKVALVVPTVMAGGKDGEWLPSPIVYPIAQIGQSSKPLAAQFIAFILSPEGQAILLKHGFVSVQK